MIVTPKETLKLSKNEDGSKTLLLHSFCIKNASANYDQTKQTISFKGTADFEGYRNLKSYTFDVSGPILKGRGLLKPTDNKGSEKTEDKSVAPKDAKFIAAVFCNDANFSSGTDTDKAVKDSCGSFFIDLYVKVPGYETELFDEQVEDCAKSDQCLQDSSSTPSAPSTIKDSGKDTGKDANKDKKKETPAPAAPSPKDAPVKAPVKDGDKPIEKADPQIKPATPTQSPETAAADLIPAGLEVNADNKDDEPAEFVEAPSSYVGLNTPNRINLFFDILDEKESAKTENADLFQSSSNDNPRTLVDSAEAPDTKSGTAAPPKDRPESKTPAKPTKPVKTPVVTPTKSDKTTSTDKAPETKPEAPPVAEENKTIAPSPIDPTIQGNEFPFNMSVPTRGPMQVHVLKYPAGYLVGPSELKEPTPDKRASFIIDRTTKNLSNPNYRKTFGAFYVVEFLEKLADFTFPLLKTPIRINDISLHRGGYLSPHQNHQYGLDVDVEYMLIPKDYSHEMTPEQKWIVFQRVGASPLVNYILLDTRTKKAVCEIANLRKDFDNNSRLAMQKLKIDEKHITHFHINFSCTYNSDCRQPDITIQSQYPKNEGECLAYKMRTPLKSSDKR